MHVPFTLIIVALIAFGLSVSAQGSDAKLLLDASFTPQGELSTTLYPQLAASSIEFQHLPGPVLTLFGNQRIRIDLTLNDGSSETLGVVTVNNAIQTLTRYAPSNPTMKVTTDETTANAIVYADDKASAFVQAVNTGKLKYEGLSADAQLTTFVADVVVFLTNLIHAFAGLLGY